VKMVEPIRTNAGWVAHGHNYYRGYSLRDDLTHDSLWSMISLAIGHRRLTAEESRYLDEIAMAMPAPDPRLWPVKLMWLVGCYGSPYAATAIAHLAHGRSLVGPGCMAGAARLWQELYQAVTTDGREAAFEAWIEKYKDISFPFLPGFGTPTRRVDERIELLEHAAERHGYAEGPYYRLCVELQEALEPTPVRVNVNAAFAASMLDLGFDPEQIGMLGQLLLHAPLWANAVEAARLRPPGMMDLGPEGVDYTGPAARRSPRAIEHQERSEPASSS
jgi:hypothetical protein